MHTLASAPCSQAHFNQKGMHMRSLRSLITIGSTTLLLSACLVPEQFNAKVEFQSDGSYTFRYVGSAVHAMAAAQIKKSGSLSAKDEDALMSEVVKMEKRPEVKKATYKGAGRYDLDIQDAKKPGQPLKMFNIFSVITDPKSGVTELSSPKLTEKSKADLEQLGMKIDGKLEVSLPKNAEVIFSNATSTPTLRFGSYSWKIGAIGQRAEMKVKFK